MHIAHAAMVGLASTLQIERRRGGPPMLETNTRSLSAALLLVPALALAQTEPHAAPSPAPIPSIAVRTTGMRHTEGFLPLDWDARSGRIYIEVAHFDSDLLLTHSLPHGMGSN